MGWISNIVAGLIGSAIGQGLLGYRGTQFSWDVFDAIHYWHGDFSLDCVDDFWQNTQAVSHRLRGVR
jgi:hypothetical protein